MFFSFQAHQKKLFYWGDKTWPLESSRVTDSPVLDGKEITIIIKCIKCGYSYCGAMSCSFFFSFKGKKQYIYILFDPIHETDSMAAIPGFKLHLVTVCLHSSMVAWQKLWPLSWAVERVGLHWRPARCHLSLCHRDSNHWEFNKIIRSECKQWSLGVM